MAALPVISNQLILYRLEKQLDIHFRSKPVFLFVPGRITLQNRPFRYQNRFDVESGWVELQYPVTALFPRGAYSFQIKAKNLTVTLGDDLSRAFGKKRVLIDYVFGDFAVINHKGVEIKSFDVESKEIEFHIKPRG